MSFHTLEEVYNVVQKSEILGRLKPEHLYLNLNRKILHYRLSTISFCPIVRLLSQARPRMLQRKLERNVNPPI